MASVFNNIVVLYSEYQYWLENNQDDTQLQYLFEIYDVARYHQTVNNSIDLSGFFQEYIDESDPDSDTPSDEIYHVSSNQSWDVEYGAGDSDHVDVMIDDSNILIESNSLRAVKYVAYKFIESGYILQRDYVCEKMFRKDKVTRYLRVFKIINHIPNICSN